MTTQLIAVFTVLLAATVALLDQSKQGEPPSGFEWQKCTAARLTILKPKDWFFREKAADGTHAFAISKERIKQGGSFKTGLTVNYVTDVSQRAKLTASQYAEGFAGVTLEKHERQGPVTVKTFDIPNHGPIKSYIFRVRIAEPPEPLIMHFALVADDKLDCVHMMYFESPEAEWKQAWQFGNVMLRDFKLSFMDK